MIEEEWRDIEGFPGYKISNCGRAMNFKKDPNGEIMHQSLDAQFYNRIALSNNGKSKQPTVHKLVAQAFIPNPNNEKLVLHLDGTRDNNHVSNLAWGKRGDVKKSKRGTSQYIYVPKTVKYYPVPLYDESTTHIHNTAWTHEIFNYYNVPQKICSTCREIKPLDMFNRDKGNKDGYQYRCRDCEKAHYRDNVENVSESHKRWYRENREKRLLKGKQWSEANKDYLIMKRKKYYLDNIDRLIEKRKTNKDQTAKRQKIRYKQNREKFLAKNKEYYQKNKEAYKEMVHRYSASPRGREVDRLKRAKRKEFGYEPINKAFEGSAYHHLHLNIGGEVDKSIGVHIPFELHNSVYHNNYTGQGMREINRVALLWLTEQATI